jgi:hypothetical protein
MREGRETRPTTEQDEIERATDPQPEEERDPTDVAEQDFATRNVIMSNALQGGASPAAGGVIGSGGELGMQPPTDEEVQDEEGLPADENR